MSMKALEDLREMLCVELDEIAKKQEMSAGDLKTIHELTDTIKNIDKICMLEDGEGYSEAIDGDGYGRGSSYANRGQHWVRGHYSRDGGMDGRYSSRRDMQGRYSRDDGRSNMMEHLEMALNSATEQDREAIRRMIQKLENA